MSKTPLTLEQEIKKQLLDQTGHAFWGFLTGFAPLGMATLTGFGQLGVTAGWISGAVMLAGSGCYWTRRERLQAEDGSRMWWDPLLDNGVFWVFVAAGAISSRFILLGGTTP